MRFYFQTRRDGQPARFMRWMVDLRLNEEEFIMAWALVTGASSGIGQSVAIELSKNYDVILCGRNHARLEETRKSLRGGGICLSLELGEAETAQEALSEALKSNGICVEAFASCAGCMGLLPLRVSTPEKVRAMLEVNLLTPMMLTRVLVSRPINHGALKSIVFVSSNISNRGAKAFSAYGASKSGVDGMMRCLAVELAPAVRVNSVLPGAVRTPMTEAIFSDSEVVKRMAATYPLGIGTPQAIADAVAFLCSEKATWITGQQLTVDGGRTINITG
ncbi:MAG: SDR family oxidoreductase [Kiritimatiellia bacterium]